MQITIIIIPDMCPQKRGIHVITLTQKPSHIDPDCGNAGHTDPRTMTERSRLRIEAKRSNYVLVGLRVSRCQWPFFEFPSTISGCKKIAL